MKQDVNFTLTNLTSYQSGGAVEEEGGKKEEQEEELGKETKMSSVDPLWTGNLTLDQSYVDSQRYLHNK